jgi:hypothetical protein
VHFAGSVCIEQEDACFDNLAGGDQRVFDAQELVFTDERYTTEKPTTAQNRFLRTSRSTKRILCIPFPTLVRDTRWLPTRRRSSPAHWT